MPDHGMAADQPLKDPGPRIHGKKLRGLASHDRRSGITGLPDALPLLAINSKREKKVLEVARKGLQHDTGSQFSVFYVQVTRRG